MDNFDKRMLKKSPEELEQYLAFKRKASYVPTKKGKGAKYDRKAFKKGVAQEDERESEHLQDYL